MTPFATLVPALVILIAYAVGHVGPAVAGPVPDGAQMALMRHAIAQTPLVRMRGDFGTLRGHRPLLDSSGVMLVQRLGGSRDAMRAIPVDESQMAPIPWPEISTIETDRAGSAAKSTVIGGLIGLLLGAGLAMSSVDVTSLRNQQDQSGAILLAPVVGGFALGYLIGQHGKRRTIYPRETE